MGKFFGLNDAQCDQELKKLLKEAEEDKQKKKNRAGDKIKMPGQQGEKTTNF